LTPLFSTTTRSAPPSPGWPPQTRSSQSSNDFVNKSQGHNTRINFSVCHEIAHTFFPDAYETSRHRRKQQSQDAEYLQLEWLCDMGAAELLMPHVSFAVDLAPRGTSLQAVRELRDLYATSSEAVLIRVSQLSKEPCAVVFLSEKFKPAELKASQTAELDLGLPPVAPKLRVDYVRAASGFSVFIPQDKSVPRDSVAYSCLVTNDIAEGTEEWDLPGFGKWRVQAVALPNIAEYPRRRVAALVLPGSVG